MTEVSTSLCMAETQFKQELDLFLNQVSNFEFRLSELLEFQSQWKNIFETLKLKYGSECMVQIKNYYVYESFLVDKFQVLTSDLFSFSCNQLDKASFASRCQEYVQQTVRNSSHQEALDGCKEISAFISNIRTLKEDIKDIRNYLDHKHQISIIHKSKNNGVFDTNIDTYLVQIEKIINELIGFIENLFLVCKGSPLHFGRHTPTIVVSNQIDLILFGNISNALRQFSKKSDVNESYDTARELYFNSEDFLEYIIYGSK